jgi:hypothetical protein
MEKENVFPVIHWSEQLMVIFLPGNYTKMASHSVFTHGMEKNWFLR